MISNCQWIICPQTVLTCLSHYFIIVDKLEYLKQIVLLHREDHQFNIGVQEIGSGKITPLTFSTMDESPTVAPNGRLILYATQAQHHGVLAIVSIDGRIKMRIPSRDGDVQEPAWSPFIS